MNGFELEILIKKKQSKISGLQKQVYFSQNSNAKFHLYTLLNKEINELRQLNNMISKSQNSISQRMFTVEELRKYDGSNGRPAYAAVKGVVYDVSFNYTWGGGTHFGLYAGKDLSEQFSSCHDNQEILNKLPKVGVLV